LLHQYLGHPFIMLVVVAVVANLVVLKAQVGTVVVEPVVGIAMALTQPQIQVVVGVDITTDQAVNILVVADQVSS
jgi:hypothetical protein